MILYFFEQTKGKIKFVKTFVKTFFKLSKTL